MVTAVADWTSAPVPVWGSRSTALPRRPIGYLRSRRSGPETSSAASLTPSHSRANEYVTASLSRLTRDSALPPATVTRAREILQRTMTGDDLLPYLTADDDELHVHWIAGRASLELSIPPSGDIYVRVTNAAGSETYVDFVSRAPVAGLRRVIRQLTRVVEQGNPRWRQIFE